MDLRRALLESLKYLHFRDVLHAALVSSDWRRAAAHEELWIVLGQSLGLHSQSQSEFFEAVLGTSLGVSKRYYQFGIYNPVLGTWMSADFKKKIFFHHSRTMLMLSAGSMLICGGTSKHVYIFNIITGKIRQLPQMLKRRQSPGAISDGEFVYAFGGYFSQNFDSCEKLNLSSESWEEMPDMLAPRSNVLPCLLRMRIFLCGGRATSCEQYDIRLNEFSWLPLTFPDSNVPVFAAVKDNSLVLVLDSHICVYDENLQQVSCSPHAINRWTFSSGMNLVVIGNCLYYTRNWDTIYCIDLLLNTNTAVFPPHRV